MFAGKIKQGLGDKSVQPQGQEFPALQATQYKFITINANTIKKESPESLVQNYFKLETGGYVDRPYLAMNEASKDLLSLEQEQFLGLVEGTFYFDEKDKDGNTIGQKAEKLYVVSENIRWIVLSNFNTNRNTYKKVKGGNKIQKSEYDSEWSNDFISTSRAYIAAYDTEKESLLLNKKNEIQIFSIGAESKKSKYLFGNYKDLPTATTIHGLNNRIKKEMGEYGWYAHLAHVKINPSVVTITSKDGKQSSLAAVFILSDVDVLPSDIQDTTDEFVKGEFFTELNADPFRLNKQGQSPAEEPKTRLPQTALTPDYEDADKTTEELTEEQKKELEEIPF